MRPEVRTERERCAEAMSWTWQCPSCRCLRPEPLWGQAVCEACRDHAARLVELRWAMSRSAFNR